MSSIAREIQGSEILEFLARQTVRSQGIFFWLTRWKGIEWALGIFSEAQTASNTGNGSLGQGSNMARFWANIGEIGV